MNVLTYDPYLSRNRSRYIQNKFYMYSKIRYLTQPTYLKVKKKRSFIFRYVR